MALDACHERPRWLVDAIAYMDKLIGRAFDPFHSFPWNADKRRLFEKNYFFPNKHRLFSLSNFF
jgi:hypothetical protein